MTDYATIAEIKAAMNKTGAGDDAVLTALATAASRAVDNFCNRPDGFVALTEATARVYAGEGKSWQTIDECTSVTEVAVKDSTTDDDYTDWTTADWIAFSGDPEHPEFNRLPYTALMVGYDGDYAHFLNGRRGKHSVPTMQITAKWGYATDVPTPIKQATIITASRWYKRGEGGWSDVLASGELGMLLYQKMLDPDVKLILVAGRYVRPAV